MFVETNKQEGTQNPIGFFETEKETIKFLPEIDLAISIFGMFMFFLAIFTGFKIDYIENFISGFFLLDFFIRLVKADDKKTYLKRGWLNLVLCVPFYPTTWMVVTLTLRMLKGILEYTLIKVDSAYASMAILGASLVSFSTISILQFETLPICNIKSVWDAVWWSVCTITTVGYGDKFPMTDGGKVVAIILMVCGIGLFGTLIGYISTFFTDKEKKNNKTVDTIEELSAQIHGLSEQIKNLKK
jgi:voltage-gated potassium channel